MSIDLADRLVAAVSEERREAGISIQAEYQPVGGPGGRTYPPTFPGGSYLTESRLVDGSARQSIVIDQVPSQANRIEEQLQRAISRGRVALPTMSLQVPTPAGPVTLTSLDAPHRYADAYWRDSTLDGVRFDASDFGKALRSASADDVRVLFEREPYTLLFGAWDSHRKGRQAKFPRLYSSEMFGLDPQLGARQAGRVDPLNMSGAVDDSAKANGDWKFIASGEKAKGKKLSEIGHGHIAPNPVHGGATVTVVHRRGWISSAGLERLQFGDAPDEAAALARACLAALALLGDRLTFGGPSLWLRSGCDLTKVCETVAFEVQGGELEPVDVTVASALEAFAELRERAAKAGLAMADNVVTLEPTPQLAQAVVFAVTRATPDSGD